MASPSPPWRVKSRPCPFYSQGRCLFADSCNFLHQVKVHSNLDDIFVGSPHSTLNRQTTPSPTSSASPVESPTRKHRSIRSPRRSPRLSQLLLALQDVIGVEDEDGDEEAASEEETPTTGTMLMNETGNPASHESDDPWTFVGNSGSTSPVTAKSESFLDEEGTSLIDEPELDEDHPHTVRVKRSFEVNDATIVSSPTAYESPPRSLPEESARATLDLLSPIDVSNLPLIPFLRDESTKRDDSFDSGYADSWTSLQPMRLSPPRSPTRLSSTFDLLSSPFGSPSSRVLSPRLNAFMGRLPGTEVSHSPQYGPSLSVANAEVYTPAQPDSGYDTEIQSIIGDVDDLSLSEPEEEQTIKFVATLSHVERQPSHIRSPASGSSEFEDDEILAESTLADASPAPSSEGESLDILVDPSVDCKPDLASVGHDSGPSHAEQYISPESRSPVVEASSLAPSIPDAPVPDDSSHVDNPAASDTVSPLDQPSSDIPMAALHGGSIVLSPVSHPPQVADSATSYANDSVDAVYDAYSHLSSPLRETDQADEQIASGSSLDIGTLNSSYQPSHRITSPYSSSRPSFTHGRAFTPPLSRGRMGSFFGTPTSPLSRSSSPAGLSSPFRQDSPNQGRVFSPPPGWRRAGTSRGTSPQSSASPVGLDPTFQGKSPESVSAKAKGKHPARSPTSGDDMPAKSTKVPFGFRSSAALGRGKGTSNRVSRSIPPSLTRLRIITDPTKTISTTATESPLSTEAYRSTTRSLSASPVTAGLKPLRLSTILSANRHALSPPLSPKNSISQLGSIKRASMSSTSVSSDFSLSHNNLLSSARSSLIPEHIRNTLIPAPDTSLSPLPSDHFRHFPDQYPPQSAPVSHSHSWNAASHRRIGSRNRSHLDSHSLLANRRFESISSEEDETEENDNDAEGEEDSRYDQTIRLPIPRTAPLSHPVPSVRSPFHAIATPRPTLLFAIASDDPTQVRKVLESGDAGPNDQVGPQSALTFTLMNGKLTRKVEMVKILLAFGADPAVVNTNLSHSSPPQASSDDGTTPASPPSISESIDPATRYYVSRANAPHTRQTSALIYRSFFRPLTRVRYDMIGQDRALEQLFRVLSIHSQQLSVTPIVVLLCGPSGHGKSLLARKFGSHLDVPTHTVNMTTLRSTHELWQSYSMSPYEELSNCTLAEFLINNEGKRCVVVLDEIEKTADERTLWSLLMPWELGRCSLEADSRHIDVRNVVWLGTSNIGHNMIFEHHETRQTPGELMSREEYLALTGLLRPVVSERLGASLLSRVTAVLPFVPFSPEEKKAVAAEALYALGGELVTTLSPAAVESMVARAVSGYIPAEGARSLYRAVSGQLIDSI